MIENQYGGGGQVSQKSVKNFGKHGAGGGAGGGKFHKNRSRTLANMERGAGPLPPKSSKSQVLTGLTGKVAKKSHRDGKMTCVRTVLTPQNGCRENYCFANKGNQEIINYLPTTGTTTLMCTLYS